MTIYSSVEIQLHWCMRAWIVNLCSTSVPANVTLTSPNGWLNNSAGGYINEIIVECKMKNKEVILIVNNVMLYCAVLKFLRN